jgi:hypothetical protein
MKVVTVVDETREDAVIGESVQVADTFWTRLIGLMGRKSLAHGSGMLLNPCSSIHTCWMRIPIDVLYLDGNMRVLALNTNLKPWRIGTIRMRTQKVLELPVGTIALHEIKVGDRLSLAEPALLIASAPGGRTAA